MAAAGEADRKNTIQVPTAGWRAHHRRFFPCRVTRRIFFMLFFNSMRPSPQVAASRPVAFYASLAKRLLLDNATVELSAIGQS